MTNTFEESVYSYLFILPHKQIVQYLIAKGADVNLQDRWGATPLADAVQSGHLQVVEQILSRGGVMATTLGNLYSSTREHTCSQKETDLITQFDRLVIWDCTLEETHHIHTRLRIFVPLFHSGPVVMCNAATEGDVRYLKLLFRCGVDPDVSDYDQR